ncbi:MAG: biosynthetic peptidoglycan transglycosylase [Clostridiaceae bacterium]
MRKIKKIIVLLLIIVFSYNVYFLNFSNNNFSMQDDLIEKLSSNMPNYTRIDEIPEYLKNATIAVEDRRFYTHGGFDMRSIGRAAVVNLKEGEIKEGGSTITQQLAKNLFLTNEKSYIRKIKELGLALKIENKYSKDEILEMYLNVVYYGANSYGVAEASKKYFNKEVWQLSLGECAMLAGLTQAPSSYEPSKYYAKAKKRQEIVLKSMYRYGSIDEKVMEEGINETINICN